MYDRHLYPGGACQLNVLMTWGMRTNGRTMQSIEYHNWTEAFRTLPLIEMDERAGRTLPFWKDWVRHPTYDDYWAATNVEPERKPSEIMACDPYFIGSHSGASGAWVSGPADLQTAETKGEYCWGYPNMTTVKGLFAAGDASGASSHKFSSGSHAEGRIAAKAALAYCVDHKAAPKVDQAQVDKLQEKLPQQQSKLQEERRARDEQRKEQEARLSEQQASEEDQDVVRHGESVRLNGRLE
jgi:succinate dehydrogenase/fumarate reductase flavoprotein subunit